MRMNRSPLLPLAALAIVTAGAQALADMPAAQQGNVEAAASEVDRTLDRLTRELSTTEAEIDKARSTAETVRKRMHARTRTWYKLTHVGLLPMGAGFDTLLAHSSRAERLRRSVERDLATVKELDQTRTELLDRKQKLIARKMPLEMQAKAMAQARAALQEADDRKRAFDRAFAASTGADQHVAIYGALTPTGPASPDEGVAVSHDGFRTMKGRLPFPLAGRAEVRMVNRQGAGGPGVEMRAPAGSPVRAVYAGRVAFSDEYGDYGRVVILDHGDHYFTVSGSLGTIEVKIGDDLAAGNRLGTVATSGRERGVLYFEVRHGADTLDPAPWFGL